MSKSFDFKNCNFDNIEAGVNYFVSFLKEHNYVEFCKETNPNFPEHYAYRIAVKKLADNVFVISDGIMNLNAGEELHFQDCVLRRSLKSVYEYVFERIKKDYEQMLSYENVDNEKDYFHDRYAYVEDMFIA